MRLSAFSAFFFAAVSAFSASPEKPPAPELPGPLPDGAVLLPNQWRLRPAGDQVAVGDFPVNIAIHPGGKYAAVLHCGYGPHEIVILDMQTRAIASRQRINEAFYGLAFSADGARLVCSGSSDETLHAFHFANGTLSAGTALALRDKQARGVPAGVAMSADALTLYTADLWGQSVTRIRLARDSPQCDHLPLGEKPAAAPVPVPADSTDDPSITKRERALLDATDPSAPFPYACLLDEKRHRLYVSCWGRGHVAVIDTTTFAVAARWATDAHPNELALSKDGRRLFVACANDNAVSLIDTATGTTTETLLAELQPGSPPGNTPNSLALSPDSQRLFVANAGINAVSVFDIATPGAARSLGFIPVGWYPTSVRITADGRTLLVANGKGTRSFPNPEASGSPAHIKGDPRQYIGTLMQGSVSFISLPQGEKWETQMKTWTASAYAGIPPSPAAIPPVPSSRPPTPLAPPPTTPPASPHDPSSIPPRPLQPSPQPARPALPPIEHVLYIIKENRTYDQVLGDMKEGNGDPALCLFPEKVTPNHHAIARQFVLLDNFYVDAEVSADGHEWSMAAYATDFVEKTWPLSYGHGKGGKFPYPSEGAYPIATPARGYLWDMAKAAGITYRSYGEFVHNGRTPADPCTTRLPALRGHFDPKFRSFDTDYPDQLRADRFIAELHRFEAEGAMPRLQIIRLPNDHTSGTSPGAPTPSAQVADNDLALGRVVEAVSRSKFWPHTAIFVLEDDAQNGPDHIDAHRSPAFLISPYARHAAVDSHMYSTTSVLHTIELLLGLGQMSQFDAAARPLAPAFQAEPDLTPYTARPAGVSLGEKNTRLSFGARASQKMDFSREDAVDDRALNDLLWHAIRGAASQPPAPRRAAFVLTATKKPGAEADGD